MAFNIRKINRLVLTSKITVLTPVSYATPDSSEQIDTAQGDAKSNLTNSIRVMNANGVKRVAILGNTFRGAMRACSSMVMIGQPKSLERKVMFHIVQGGSPPRSDLKGKVKSDDEKNIVPATDKIGDCPHFHCFGLMSGGVKDTQGHLKVMTAQPECDQGETELYKDPDVLLINGVRSNPLKTDLARELTTDDEFEQAVAEIAPGVSAKRKSELRELYGQHKKARDEGDQALADKIQAEIEEKQKGYTPSVPFSRACIRPGVVLKQVMVGESFTMRTYGHLLLTLAQFHEMPYVGSRRNGGGMVRLDTKVRGVVVDDEGKQFEIDRKLKIGPDSVEEIGMTSFIDQNDLTDFDLACMKMANDYNMSLTNDSIRDMLI